MDTTNTRGYIALLTTLLVLGSCEGASAPTRQQPAAQPAAETSMEIQTRRLDLDGRQPITVTKADPGVWVTTGQHELLRLRYAKVIERFPTDVTRVGITEAARALWMTGGGDGGEPNGTLLALEPRTGDAVQRMTFPNKTPYGIDEGHLGIFVALFQGQLLQLHPGGDEVSRVQLGDGLTQVHFAQKRVWVSQPRAGQVWVVNAGKEGIVDARRIPLTTGDDPSCPQGIDSSFLRIALDRVIWVADPCAGVVWLLDARTGDKLGQLDDVGERPVDVDVSRGWAWVVSMRDRVVTAVDAKSFVTIGRAKAGKGALSILARGHQAWVTNTEDYSLTYLWTEGQPD